jgi:hypothetical protein
MEPENPTVETTASNTWNQVTPLSRYLAIALFIAMPFIGGWIGYTYAPEKVVEIEIVNDVENGELSTKPRVISRDTLFSTSIYNVSYVLPEGWIDVTENKADVLLPEIRSAILVLMNPSNGCVIAHGEPLVTFRQKYESVSFDNGIKTKDLSFSGTWSIPKSGYTMSMGLSAKRKYSTGEVRDTPQSTHQNGKFFLWQKDGGSVPDECDDSLNNLLLSAKDYFETVLLSNLSAGILEIRHDNPAESTATATLLIIEATGETFRIFDIPDDVDLSAFYVMDMDKKIYGKKISDMGIQSGIVQLDPYSGTIIYLANDSLMSKKIYGLDTQTKEAVTEIFINRDGLWEPGRYREYGYINSAFYFLD